MGKIAKRRRTKAWKDAQAIRELKRRLKCAEQERDDAQAKRRRIEQGIREFAAVSTLLRAESKVPAHTRRVPIEERLYHARYDWNSEISRMDQMPFESLMHLIAASPIGNDLRRCVHFRVVNAPAGKPDFAVGYAVSHHALQFHREQRSHFVRLISENIAADVFNQLFPREEGEKL